MFDLTFNKISLHLRSDQCVPSFAESASRHEGSTVVVRLSDSAGRSITFNAGLDHVRSSCSSLLVTLPDTSPTWSSSSIFVVVDLTADFTGVTDVTPRDASTASLCRFSIRGPSALTSSSPRPGVVVLVDCSVVGLTSDFTGVSEVTATSRDTSMSLCRFSIFVRTPSALPSSSSGPGVVFAADRSIFVVADLTLLSDPASTLSADDVTVSDTSPVFVPLPPGVVVVRVSDCRKPGNDHIEQQATQIIERSITHDQSISAAAAFWTAPGIPPSRRRPAVPTLSPGCSSPLKLPPVTPHSAAVWERTAIKQFKRPANFLRGDFIDKINQEQQGRMV